MGSRRGSRNVSDDDREHASTGSAPERDCSYFENEGRAAAQARAAEATARRQDRARADEEG